MSTPRARSAHAVLDHDPSGPRHRSRLVRLLAGAASALLLGSGLALVGVAAPAAAHHNTITATAVCETPTTYTVTWKIENSEKIGETITSSSNEALVAKGLWIGPRETKTVVQKGVAKGDHRLELTAKWDNGQTQRNSGGISAAELAKVDVAPCTPAQTPPPVEPTPTPTPTPEPPVVQAALTGSIAAGVCEANAPYIDYTVVLTDPQNRSTSRDAKLVLSDGTNTESVPLGTIPAEGTLSGRVLWPGAKVENGVAVAWPGWTQIGGRWVQTEQNYGWTRDLTSATIEVNPTVAVALAYPPATPNCSGGPSAGGAPGGGTGLAETGFEGAGIAIGAGAVALVGIVLLVVSRLRKRA